MDKLDKKIQKQIIEGELQRWRAELELMSIRSRVADAIQDKQMKEDVTAHSQKCLKAIDELSKALKELDGKSGS